ncbi:MAG TPA: alpha/beta hydrolase [Dehalococcoidia bacterium]|nr:alpha/beta hydrolase [Dehalococcoidia bacterium]
MLTACGDGDGAAPRATATPAASPTAPATPTSAPFVVAPADWGECGSGLQCATVRVPLDHANPGGGTISIAIARLPARDASQRIGSLVINVGGPGESGVEFLRNGGGGIYSDAIRDRFDIVSFDPRGVGDSEPAFDCLDDLDPWVYAESSPDTPEERAEVERMSREFAEACAERSGELLPYLATEDVARDMDMIREALGDEKLTYLGYSYGTFLGAIYAELFPDRIRAFVLDGAVDPSLPPQEDARNQIMGFEEALQAFLDDCASDASCDFYNGGDPGAAYDALLATIEQEPLPVGDGRTLGPGAAWLGVAAGLYDELSWSILAGALADAQDGDGTLLQYLADFLMGRNDNGTWNNAVETRVATRCLDAPGLTEDEERALNRELMQLAPRFGPDSEEPIADVCDFWPVPPRWSPRPIAAAGAPPIVVIGTTGDPATPYQQAVGLAGQLASGVLVTYEGEGHTVYAGTSDCIDEAVDTYFIELLPPPDGLVC